MISSSYRFLIRVGKIAGGATFLLGLFLGVHQYFEAKYQKRVDQTLALHRMWSSPPYTQYRANITRLINANADGLRQAAQREDLLRDALFALMKDGETPYSLMMLMDLFDTLQVCIAARICDEDLSVLLFRDPAHEYFIMFYQYINAVRGGAPRFGRGLEIIATWGKAS